MWKRRRLTAKRYPGDNRLIFPKSPYRRTGLAPRCRLVASWGWSRSQGLGCSPIKAVRELGLERRETVNRPELTALSINSAICWKLRASAGTRPFLSVPVRSMMRGWTVTIHAVRTISRKGRAEAGSESSESICRTPPDQVVKIWSDLHGDMQSQAE